MLVQKRSVDILMVVGLRSNDPRYDQRQGMWVIRLPAPLPNLTAGRVVIDAAARSYTEQALTSQERSIREGLTEAMEALERASLARLGIADPYGATLTEEKAAANE